jgi:glycosyltransferase involved in cell wall biosynthesis
MYDINLSVVIPTYRRPRLLKRCLDTLRAQTYPSPAFEIIVVSDGPDPLTENLIKQAESQPFGPRLRYKSLTSKSGPAAARNAGWQMSKAELILFTDDDCLPDVNWVNAFWDAYIHQKDLATHVCFTGKVEVPVSDRPTDYEKNVAYLSTAEFITANCALSRATLDMLRGFDESFPVAWREDSDLQFRLLNNNIPIIHLRQARVCHPVRDAVWGISLFEQKKSMFNALLFKKHRNLYRERIASRPVWKYYLIVVFSIIALIALIAGKTHLSVFIWTLWALLIFSFARIRLQGTSQSFSHRLEMIVTSVAIPYLSIYWTLRGAWRYKVFFL